MIKSNVFIIHQLLLIIYNLSIKFRTAISFLRLNSTINILLNDKDMIDKKNLSLLFLENSPNIIFFRNKLVVR